MYQHKIYVCSLRYLQNGKKVKNRSDKSDIIMCYAIFQFAVNPIEIQHKSDFLFSFLLGGGGGEVTPTDWDTGCAIFLGYVFAGK